MKKASRILWYTNGRFVWLQDEEVIAGRLLKILKKSIYNRIIKAEQRQDRVHRREEDRLARQADFEERKRLKEERAGENARPKGEFATVNELCLSEQNTLSGPGQENAQSCNVVSSSCRSYRHT